MRNATTGRHHDAAGATHDLDTEHPNWEEIYARGPRWDIGRPQPAFLALAASGAVSGRVLDVGCGTGEHVLMCADIGLDATGVDIAGAAIDAAERKAHERGLNACFTGDWRVDSIEETTLDSLSDEDGIPAWLIALTRT